ncbi:DNA-binding GntR family transcriptional regulator [Saccharomonospora amisosensis]|uniref:DNA-binding GntR family transcriptional regulator n=1 Tax=Saccharomonospora amisosensis TaxID=1128677 RepID=A0A7X5UT13_9PSEU|nr:GntR family transcriptional regulator [Saccharomonospora amisosensis]NIJ13696.1 DNA-binding GntR family transcriptional regulator [Saccharomonospora amisosensis]
MRQIDTERNLAKTIFDELRAAVVSGELAPGELYSVHDLAARLGVSRTPVREALIQLSERGMVRFERNRGIRILRTSAHDLEEVFAIRLLLEVPATFRATQLHAPGWVERLREHLEAMRAAAEEHDEAAFMAADRRFHETVNIASGNPRLARYVDSLRDMVSLRGNSTVDRSRGLADILTEHETIFEFIADGKAGQAAEAMRAHLLHTAELLIEQEAEDNDDVARVELDWTNYPG